MIGRQNSSLRTYGQADPIFVHASVRSGSTYFFHVLRKIDSLMCFKDPMCDAWGYWGKEGSARFSERVNYDYNHKFLTRDDSAEMIEAWDAVMHLYPSFPEHREYLSTNGAMQNELYAYVRGLLEFARSHGKRPAICENYSRGRAGALRGSFGGFHIAQYRDPLSQFGSFFRTLPEAGEWYFLVFPLMELGISGDHPLYRIVPERWAVPVLPWPIDNKARRWATAAQYNALAGEVRPDAIENLFRWHLFSWVLSNIAAVSYSDLALDIDKLYDDISYRDSVIEALTVDSSAVPNFGDIAKFSRYYEFEAVDVVAVCGQVEMEMRGALRDGRLNDAIRVLGIQEPTIPVAIGLELLLTKMRSSLEGMLASSERRYVTVDEWRTAVRRHRMIWFNPLVRELVQRVYPLAAPVVRLARRSGIWH